MKAFTNQNPRQPRQKANTLIKNRKPANLSRNETNPLFELANTIHFTDPKKIKSEQRTIPENPW